MLDAHCHLDLYPDPSRIALEADRAGVFTVLVTNLPSAFDTAFPHVQQFKRVRLALGLHPLCAKQHSVQELERFKERVTCTSFIGEVGLDFSPEGYATKEKQLASFQFVLNSLAGKPKFVTIHSRRAEQAVLDLVGSQYGRPIVFHWFSGATKVLDAAIREGHYFSINPAMILSERGIALLASIPAERILTESDGPFVTIGSRPVVPSDVQLVETKLAEMWSTTASSVRRTISKNFDRLLAPIQAANSERIS